MAALNESVQQAKASRGEDAAVHEMPKKKTAQKKTAKKKTPKKQSAKKLVAKRTTMKTAARRSRSV
ncbi:hypothetical protein ABZ379_44500 [Streptomyces canus]|uniref:hypothetical protein n=1 Tax=Streptomyces canus TaxID=58343 RepID=UPI0033D7CCFF